MRKTRRGKALDITRATRDAVRERDGGCCILCGSNQGQPNAHFIARSQGGLGIEQNIVTLCPNCHYLYDQTVERIYIKQLIAGYLLTKYDGWNEKALYYKKGGENNE